MIKWIDNEDGERGGGGNCCISFFLGVEGEKLVVDFVINLVFGFLYNN